MSFDLDRLRRLGIPSELADFLASVGSSFEKIGSVTVDHTDSPFTPAVNEGYIRVDSSGGTVQVQLPNPAAFQDLGVTIVQIGGDSGTSVQLLPFDSEQINGLDGTFTLPGSDSAVENRRAYRVHCVAGLFWDVI